MAFPYGTYTWDSLGSSDEDDWIFTDEVGTGVQDSNTPRRWCWDSNDTTSTDVGPTSGQGGSPDGYLYTEASDPAAASDEFTMELDFDLDASANNITVGLYTNQRGTDNDATCEVQTKEGGGGWITRATYGGSGDPNKVATGGSQIWAQRSVDLTGIVSHAQTRIRFLITLAGANIWHCDYGIDTVIITGVASGWSHKINTVTNIAKVNTVLVSNIEKINTI